MWGVSMKRVITFVFVIFLFSAAARADYGPVCGCASGTADLFTYYNVQATGTITATGTAYLRGGAEITGTCTATAFIGDGSGLTSVPAQTIEQTLTAGATATTRLNPNGGIFYTGAATEAHKIGAHIAYEGGWTFHSDSTSSSSDAQFPVSIWTSFTNGNAPYNASLFVNNEGPAGSAIYAHQDGNDRPAMNIEQAGTTNLWGAVLMQNNSQDTGVYNYLQFNQAYPATTNSGGIYTILYGNGVDATKDVYYGKTAGHGSIFGGNHVGPDGDLVHIDDNGVNAFSVSHTGIVNATAAVFTGTATATEFVGGGAGLTGVTATDNTKVLKAGDTMTGTLTINPPFGNVAIDINSSVASNTQQLFTLDSNQTALSSGSDALAHITYTGGGNVNAMKITSNAAGSPYALWTIMTGTGGYGIYSDTHTTTGEGISSYAYANGFRAEVVGTGALFWGDHTGAGNLMTLKKSNVNQFVIDNTGNIDATGTFTATGTITTRASLSWAAAATGPESAITSLGCNTIELINNTGGALASGTAVIASTSTDSEIMVSLANSTETVGFIQDNSCVNGAPCNVGIGGKCYVRMGNNTCGRGYWVYGGADAGAAACDSTPPNPTAHEKEYGHNSVNQSGTGAVSIVIVHFN
jgi:hypothetical protein